MSCHPRPLIRWPLLLTIATATTAPAQEQTARLVKDINRAPAGSTNINLEWIMPVGQGNNAVFPMETLAHGKELWTSNGTPKGTRLLKEFVPGTGSAYLHSPIAFGEAGAKKVAFLHTPQPENPFVWVTDGTDAGTVRVFESQPGLGTQISLVGTSSRGVFFLHSTQTPDSNPPGLYFTDGTVAGTRVLNPMEDGAQRFTFPYGFTSTGPWTYFLDNDGRIWRSDGTVEGTTEIITTATPQLNFLQIAAGRLFSNVTVGEESYELWSCPLEGGEWTRLAPPAATEWIGIYRMVSTGDELFFSAQQTDLSHELWVSDGTVAGTRHIPLVHQGVESSSAGSVLIPWKGSVYLTAQAPNENHELWRSDGTPAGTTRLASFTEGFPYPELREPPTDSAFFHFHAFSDKGEWELWRTQGDAASTRRVRGAPGTYPFSAQGPLIAEGKDAAFVVGDQLTAREALWRTRGKAAGAVRLTRPEKRTGNAFTATLYEAESYEMLNGKLLAFVDTGTSHELWRMSPGGGGSRSIWQSPAHLHAGSGGIGFRGITANGALFSLYNTGGLQQLWVTDGTRKGTRLLGDYGPATEDASPHNFIRAGGTWFFSTINESDFTRGNLWKTDGTPEGTTKIVAADGTAPRPLFDQLVSFNGNACFLATHTPGQSALWRSDGTAAGTILVKDVWYGHANEQATDLSVAAGKLIITVTRPSSDALWQSDGTTDGTIPVSSAPLYGRGELSPALDLNGMALFLNRYQWHRHDATGTRPVRDSIPGYHVNGWDSYQRQHAVAGGLLFYEGIEDDDFELWVTDGTSNGSRRVKDINPGPAPSYPREMVAVGNQIYFIARDEAHGYELWRSDGTEAGTVLVADIDSGPPESSPSGLKAMNGKLYFHAHRRDVGRELFSIDLPE